jgi:hypothetical protein
MTSSLIPVPRSLRLRLWYGFVAAGLFHVIAIVEGILTPGFDTSQQSISALSLGRWGWIQISSFVFLGSFIISTVGPWRKVLAGGSGARAYPVLTFLTGASVICCGLFRQDPAPGYDPENLALTAPSLTGLLHLLFAAIGALSSITGLIIMARRFAQTPLWKGWNIYSISMALFMIACITVYGIWSTESTGYAGLFERIGLLVVPVWALSFLMRLDRGVPFMQKL